MNPRSCLAELKRRNVYKVAVAYAVVAWLLIQAGSIVATDDGMAQASRNRSKEPLDCLWETCRVL